MSPSIVSTRRYQHLVVTGTPFERGYQHGSQASLKVHFNIAKYKSLSSMPSQEVVDKYVHEYYIPAISTQFPRGLEEIKGIAEGAKASLEDVVMLNARYDLQRLVRRSHGPEECTSMSLVTEPSNGDDGDVYVAQNWDQSPWLQENDSIIILQSVDPSSDDIATPRSTITLTEAGQLGRSGMNSLGMAVCANSLWSSHDYFPLAEESKAKPFLPISLSRRMVLECGNVGDGLRALWRMTRHTSNNLMIGCRSGITMDVELTPHDGFITHPQTIRTASGALRLMTHANHFTSPEMLSRSDIKDGYAGGSSFYRDTRLYQRLEQNVREGSGTLGVKEIKQAFTDHAGYPKSLCEHASGSTSVTVACVVYDLHRLEMHVSTGNPCQGKWDVYGLYTELDNPK